MSTEHTQGDSTNDYANDKELGIKHNPPIKYKAGKGGVVIHYSQRVKKSTAELTLEALNFLRANEFDVVTLVCDNPDFDGPNNVITVSGHWTKYLDRDFRGETLLEALQAAATAKRKATA